jgi:MFS family permease
MGPTYAVIFYVVLALTVCVAWFAQPKSTTLSNNSRKLKWTFLIVWYICVAGDWLQGPYVYALYESYNFPRAQIAQLFVAGFAASLVAGTFVGSLADGLGRKNGCLLYCFLYIASCVTKHFATYWVLMIGRITGGIATSLLFSVFESWLVSEFRTREGMDKDALGHIFAMMWFGSPLVAILAGIIGDVFVGFGPLRQSPGPTSFHYGGYCSPFDLAIGLLIIGGGLIMLLWKENYGEKDKSECKSLPLQVKDGVQAIFSNRPLLVLMIMVSCFEGSMFTFVFNWTPALESEFTTPAFGMIFATFMLAYMSGSSTFDLLRSRGASVKGLNQVAFALGAACFLVSGLAHSRGNGKASLTTIILCFVAFEFCVGMYMPSVSTLKSEWVPENIRSTVYNLYRVPMNGIVVIVLLCDITMTSVFIVCFALLLFAGFSTMFFGCERKKMLDGTLEDGSYGSVKGTAKGN